MLTGVTVGGCVGDELGVGDDGVVGGAAEGWGQGPLQPVGESVGEVAGPGVAPTGVVPGPFTIGGTLGLTSGSWVGSFLVKQPADVSVWFAAQLGLGLGLGEGEGLGVMHFLPQGVSEGLGDGDGVQLVHDDGDGVGVVQQVLQQVAGGEAGGLVVCGLGDAGGVVFGGSGMIPGNVWLTFWNPQFNLMLNCLLPQLNRITGNDGLSGLAALINGAPDD